MFHNQIESDIRKTVLEFFDGDQEKTTLWFSHPNPLLGGLSPNSLISIGKADKVWSFVLTQTNGDCTVID